MDRRECDMRGLVARDPDGKCYPMGKPCKEVPDEVCKALTNAYNLARFDMMNVQYVMCQKAMEDGWKEYQDLYPRTHCPQDEKGNNVYCHNCRLYSHCFPNG